MRLVRFLRLALSGVEVDDYHIQHLGGMIPKGSQIHVLGGGCIPAAIARLLGVIVEPRASIADSDALPIGART